MKIYMVSLLHRATLKKLQGKNIIAPLLHRAAIRNSMKILWSALLHMATIIRKKEERKKQDENIMVCPIT